MSGHVLNIQYPPSTVSMLCTHMKILTKFWGFFTHNYRIRNLSKVPVGSFFNIAKNREVSLFPSVLL